MGKLKDTGYDKKKKPARANDPYDNEDVEEQMDEDEIKPEEAGFMEGYNEKQRKDKRFKDILEEKD